MRVGGPAGEMTMTSVHTGPSSPQALAAITQTCADPLNKGSQVTVAEEPAPEMVLPVPVTDQEKLVAPEAEVE